MREAIRNIRDVWQEGYQRLLDEARAAGRVHELAPAQERRAHPRFPVRSPDVATRDSGPVDVRDMSLCGLAFFSPREHYAQRRLTLSLAGVFSTETDVLGCERLSDDGSGGPCYRVRCRFRDPDHGMQFLTLTLELERIEGV